MVEGVVVTDCNSAIPEGFKLTYHMCLAKQTYSVGFEKCLHNSNMLPVSYAQ